jgi:hypothetical protein
MLTNGKNRERNYSLRIYGLHELGKILHDVGFKILNVSGRPEMPGVFFGSTSPRIIILASKPWGSTRRWGLPAPRRWVEDTELTATGPMSAR